MYEEDQTKILTDDCMIITTNEKLGINEFSENVKNFTGITREKIYQIQETTG